MLFSVRNPSIRHPTVAPCSQAKTCAWLPRCVTSLIGVLRRRHWRFSSATKAPGIPSGRCGGRGSCYNLFFEACTSANPQCASSRFKCGFPTATLVRGSLSRCMIFMMFVMVHSVTSSNSFGISATMMRGSLNRCKEPLKACRVTLLGRCMMHLIHEIHHMVAGLVARLTE